MYKDVLHRMSHATNLAEIGLVIFFVVFVAVAYRTLRTSGREIVAWAQLPLEDAPHRAGTDGPASTERIGNAHV